VLRGQFNKSFEEMARKTHIQKVVDQAGFLNSRDAVETY